MVKITKKKFEDAVKDSLGIITTIAKKLNVTTKSVYEYMEKYPDMKLLFEAETERPFDMAEKVVISKLQEKDLKAARTLLLDHKKGRERGYGRNLGLEHSGEIKGETKFIVEIIDDAKQKDSGESFNEDSEQKQ